ncbi:sigma-70 family RNA polymerase sigma factor [Actinosynnema sp. NPDC020468]|uniref:RNA polymerase sigma factor n=1 Tax=Actinosynnema sp. NPDC020468 TaxID=3154488 RepID=UPI0034084B33
MSSSANSYELPEAGGPCSVVLHPTARTDAASIVSCCRAGSASAWQQLIRMFNPLVWTVARSFGLSPADVEDVCQLTWLRVVEHIDTLREPDRVSAWIVTAARREALRHLMKSSKHVPVGEPISVDVRSDETPERALLADAERDRILTAIRMLPDEHQALLGMLMTDPPASYDAISGALGIARGSIGPTRRRIINRLRELLGEEG